MSELTTDLSEEHDTATNVTEMLEAETAERLRLEKELKDLKVKRRQTRKHPFPFYLMDMKCLSRWIKEIKSFSFSEN